MRAAERDAAEGPDAAEVLGAAARLEAETLVREMMSPADPGPTSTTTAPVVAHARVS